MKDMTKLTLKLFIYLTYSFILISNVFPFVHCALPPLTQNWSLQNTNKDLIFTGSNTTYEVVEQKLSLPEVGGGSGTVRQQNIRQSTIPMLILALVAGAFIVAFKVFLLLWKVTYFTVIDPYETSGPIPGDVERAIDDYFIGEVMKKRFKDQFVVKNNKKSQGKRLLVKEDYWWKQLANFALEEIRKRFEL